jgi:dihydroneopterin aldolase
LIINVALDTDTRAAGTSDDLADTIDYSTAIRKIADVVQSQEFRLIEHVAEEVADLLLRECEAKTVKVEIIKEMPPVDEDVKAVSVAIERRRE